MNYKIGCIGVVVVFFVLWLAATLSNQDKDAAKQHEEQPGKPSEKQPCRADDLQCLGDRGSLRAGLYCADRIEKLAKHSVKWTDGAVESKFDRFLWRNKGAGEITYIGNKVEFQNAFGAFTPIIYECDLAGDGKTVLDVRVSEGRLP